MNRLAAFGLAASPGLATASTAFGWEAGVVRPAGPRTVVRPAAPPFAVLRAAPSRPVRTEGLRFARPPAQLPCVLPPARSPCALLMAEQPMWGGRQVVGPRPLLVSNRPTLVRFCAKIPSDHSRNDGCLLEPLGCGGGSATGSQVVAIRAFDALDHPEVEQPA